MKLSPQQTRRGLAQIAEKSAAADREVRELFVHARHVGIPIQEIADLAGYRTRRSIYNITEGAEVRAGG